MLAPKLPKYAFKEDPMRDNFDNDNLALCWNFLRNPYKDNYSLTERPGFLRLNGSAISMGDQDSPAFIGRRQTAMECRVATKLDFNPKGDNEEAGLVIRGNEVNRCEIGVTLKDGKRQIFFRNIVKGNLVEPVRYEEIGEGEVILSVEAKPLSYELFYQINDDPPKSMGKALTKYLTFEEVEGYLFTGVYFGMYATGNGKKNTNPADFDWFEFIVHKK